MHEVDDGADGPSVSSHCHGARHSLVTSQFLTWEREVVCAQFTRAPWLPAVKKANRPMQTLESAEEHFCRLSFGSFTGQVDSESVSQSLRVNPKQLLPPTPLISVWNSRLSVTDKSVTLLLFNVPVFFFLHFPVFYTFKNLFATTIFIFFFISLNFYFNCHMSLKQSIRWTTKSFRPNSLSLWSRNLMQNANI